jgi:hypothetical protein
MLRRFAKQSCPTAGRGWRFVTVAPFLCVAVDAEFLKTHNECFCRAVAFAPFLVHPGFAPEKQSVFRAQQLESRAVVLEPEAVMKLCDVLPCGDALSDLSEKVDVSWYDRDRLLPASVEPEVGECHGQQSTPAEEEQEKGGRMPKAHRLDPYGLPNCSRLSSAVAEFLSPTKGVPHDFEGEEAPFVGTELHSLLLPYGKGKWNRPSFGQLCRPPHGAMFRQHLLDQFHGRDGVQRWLADCKAHSLATQRQVLERMILSEQHSHNRCAEVIVCENFFSFSETLSRVMTEYQVSPRGGKRVGEGVRWPVRFLSYGSMDDVAVNNTLRLVDRQVAVADVVKLREFEAAGFGWSSRRPPSLVQCLRDLASGDDAARQLCEAEDNHNPAWDASALAAVARIILSRP